MTHEPFTEDAGDGPPPARAAPRRRGPKLALAAIVVAGLAALGWYGYDRTAPPRGGEVPLIKADTAPVKKRPAEPGGMAILDQDKLVYETLGDERGGEVVERLLPPPEEPLPPPAPPKPESAPAAPAAQAAPAPEPAPAAAGDSGASVPPPPPAKAAAAQPPPPSAAPAGAVMVQLAAFRSEAAADSAWRRLLAAHRDVLGKLDPSVERADLGAGKGVFFRLRAGPLDDDAAARALCARLKSRKLECFVVKP